ncbi:MAG: FG-GAP repeat domain-containing protein [Acidobacteriota bacterium]
MPPGNNSRFYSSPALADVDGDGSLETFIGSVDGYLYCISASGTILWKATPAASNQNPAAFPIFSSPAVGDIDGDGNFEVVVGGGNTSSSPTIADIDDDDMIEILIGNGRKGEAGYPDTGSVRVYHESGWVGDSEFGPTGVSKDIAPWPKFRLAPKACLKLYVNDFVQRLCRAHFRQHAGHFGPAGGGGKDDAVCRSGWYSPGHGGKAVAATDCTD